MSLARVIAFEVLLVADLAVAETVGDASRGGELFRTFRCVACHTVKGQGGGTAPDLGIRTGRGYTPSLMAIRMWNHAPEMWSAMQEQGVARPELSEQDAGDLFAYFYSVRYFDRPGDAARGKAVFTSKHCAMCHATGPSATSLATPVTAWRSLSDPVVLVQRMWSHFPKMRAALAERRIAWVELTPAQLRDLLVYVQNLPQNRARAAQFAITTQEEGGTLFQSKGCAGCHRGALALHGRLGDRTLTEIAAAMWNHAPKMAEGPREITEAEMRAILNHLWASQFFEAPGDTSRGRRVFVSRNCAACHERGLVPAPALPRVGKHYSVVSMVSVLWKHGPTMLERMQEKDLPWPRFQGSDIADLAAYLSGQ